MERKGHDDKIIVKKSQPRPGQPRVKKFALCALEYGTRQASRCIGARIDADAVRAPLRLLSRGVSMYDDFAEIRRGGQKSFPDPHQIAGHLFGQGQPRPHPGVGEEVIANLERQLEPLEKLAMRGRKSNSQFVARSRESLIVVKQRRRNAVARKSVASAIVLPQPIVGGIAEK